MANTRVFGLLTFYCVLTLINCFLLKYFYRVDHTIWCDGLDCPTQHYKALTVLSNEEVSCQVVSARRHIDHIAGMRSPRRHKFFTSRCRYYQNADSTFQYQRLLNAVISIPIQARRSFHVFAVRDHAKTISEPYNATAATCGATLNVLMFPRMNITGYQVLTIPGTVMPVLLSGFQTLSFLIQPGTRLTIRPLQSLTPLSLMSLLTTRPVSRLTTSSTCRLLTKTSTVFKIKWMK